MARAAEALWHRARLAGLVAAALGVFAGPARADTYDDLAAGRRCETPEAEGQPTICVFEVPGVLRLRIIGVGSPGPRVEFLKSDIDGAYYATLDAATGCIAVTPGHALRNREVDRFFDHAFISVRNGEVYRDAEACGASD